MNIFEALREDHDTQRLLVDSLVETQGDSQARKTFFEQVKTELEAHAVAEERHFYVPLMDDDLT
jgi:hemerythrin superfamily protein